MFKEFACMYSTDTKAKNWLEKFYTSSIDTTKESFIELYGKSGNGKTFLVELLAKYFNAELLRITPYDINSTEDVYQFIKSVNLQSIDGKERKIILLDDFDELQSRYQKKLSDIFSISLHPVIVTCTYSQQYKDHKPLSLIIKKPAPSVLLPFLKERAPHVSEETLLQIAQESTSVRSSFKALYSLSTEGMLTPFFSKKAFIQDVFQKKKLHEDINKRLLYSIFKKVNFDNSVDNVKFLSLLSEYDYHIMRYFY